MNLAQLELKRLTSLLGGVRKARHLAQAMRGPLAKYLSFERQAKRAWNQNLERLQMIHEYGEFEPFEPSSKERIEELDVFVSQLADDEKKVLRSIAKLEKSKRLTAPAVPIEERIAKRKKRSKAEARKAERKKSAWESFQKLADSSFSAWLITVQDKPTIVRESLLSMRRMLRAGELYDWGRELSIVHQYGGDRLAQDIKSLREDARAIVNS
jgi:hypothetical protein